MDSLASYFSSHRRRAMALPFEAQLFEVKEKHLSFQVSLITQETQTIFHTADTVRLSVHRNEYMVGEARD